MPKGGLNQQLFNCVTVSNPGQGRPKSKYCSGCLMSAILQDHERSIQVLGVLENGKVGQGVLILLRRLKITHSIYSVRPFRAVCARQRRSPPIGMGIKSLLLYMCVIRTKVGQGHPNDCVCSDSVRSINLPNMNAV